MIDTIQTHTLIPDGQGWLEIEPFCEEIAIRIQIRWQNELGQLISDEVRVYDDCDIMSAEDERMVLVEARSRARDLAAELGFATLMRIERAGKTDEYEAYSTVRPCGCCPCCSSMMSSFQAA